MKKLLPLFLAASVFAEENPYDAINKRNAFTLLNDIPILPPASEILKQPPVKLNLTGIMKYKGETNVYLFSNDIPKRFLTLNKRRMTDSGITLISVNKGLVEVNNNGVVEVLSFETHKLPSTVALPALSKPTVIKKDKKENPKKDSKSTKSSTPRPNIITVPSRNRSTSDARKQKGIEKGLEYISRMDDPEKREAMLERIEKYQRGDYDKQIKEYRKSRERKK